MAAAIIPIASTIISLVSPLLPSIVRLVQGAHPVPPDAPPAVKADLGALKATGANQLASVLINQFATAGSLPASASDPSVQAMLAGAIEQAYQAMKAQGTLNGAPAPFVAPSGALDPVFNFPFLGKFEISARRL